MRFAEFHPIETERLLLRQLQLGDVYEYYERLFGDGEVAQYMLFDPHQTIMESLEAVQQKLKRYEEEKFKLNLEKTSFANPHGLDAENHYTSAYDLAIITSSAMKNSDFKEIVSTKFMQITGHKDVGNRYLRNKQRLLKTLQGCTGVKSGFTDNLKQLAKEENVKLLTLEDIYI